MPAYEHEVELARDEGVEIRFLTSPVAFVGERHVEGVRCAEMRLGAPDESGRRRPEPMPDSEFVIPVDTVVKAIGQRPRDEFRAPAGGRRQDGRHAQIRRSSPPETRSTAARVSSRQSRKPSAPSRRSTRRCDERADRDPLACARRPGRKDGVADPGVGTAPHRKVRAGVPGVRPGAARRAAARVHAVVGRSRSAVTTRSATRTSSSCSSRRSFTRRASPRDSKPTGSWS